MKIHSVEIYNYRSIGDKDNKIILDPKVTAIIGKNESGKSNVLTGLGSIRFLNRNNLLFDANNSNRNSGAAISYKIILKPDGDIGLPDEDTTIFISESQYSAKGGILSYFNAEVGSEIKAFTDFVNNNQSKFRGVDKNILIQRCINLKTDKVFDIPLINETISQFETYGNNVESIIKDEYKKLLDTVKQKWNKLISFFPGVLYRNESRILKTEYSGETLSNELKNTNSILSQFFKYLGFDQENIKKAVSNNTSGIIKNIRDKIIHEVNEKINKPFNEFYSTERIMLDVGFQPNTITFYVISQDGATMTLGERSEGLRWYLNMFIDAQIHNVSDKKVVYLLDEPGIHLHVNAQKELLKLFDDLAEKGNQVVYTTHLPYMLKHNEMNRVRAVVKDEAGNTKIYKTPYDSKIDPRYQFDTITPLLSALGMNFGDTIGPAYGKLNIVTEGVSDTYYLKAMAKKLQLDVDKYAFIPCVGASNCVNMSLMLHGWGCKSVVLFDYDKAGVESGGQKLKSEYDFECGKDYIYIKDCTQDDIAGKEYDSQGKCIEDLVPDLQEFLNKFSIQNTGKTLNAKLYADNILSGKYDCPQDTLNNFKELFNRIDACAKLQEV